MVHRIKPRRLQFQQMHVPDNLPCLLSLPFCHSNLAVGLVRLPRQPGAKFRLAAQLGLRCVGIWHLDCLDHSCSDQTCRYKMQATWEAVRAFTGA